jgi:hypothetical protein
MSARQAGQSPALFQRFGLDRNILSPFARFSQYFFTQAS